MKKLVFIVFSIFSGLSCLATEPDMIVLQSGESLKVYNMDITSGNNIYYTLGENADGPVYKVTKDDVLIIKKADGTKINPTGAGEMVSGSSLSGRGIAISNPNAHDPITVQAIESDFVEMKVKGYKNPEKFILIQDGLGNTLNARLLSSEEKTLSISKPRKGTDYKFEKLILPEYVTIKGDIFIVREIDDEAFTDKPGWKDLKYLKEVQFPSTLKKIGEKAFHSNVSMKYIILPDGIETIGENAFARCGIYPGRVTNNLFMIGSTSAEFELYVPMSVKHCGQHAFIYVGPSRSPRGYYQGYLSSIPKFITVNNCKDFGIDENAVEDYERRIGIRK